MNRFRNVLPFMNVRTKILSAQNVRLTPVLLDGLGQSLNVRVGYPHLSYFSNKPGPINDNFEIKDKIENKNNFEHSEQIKNNAKVRKWEEIIDTLFKIVLYVASVSLLIYLPWYFSIFISTCFFVILFI